ncbi:MAG: hypothetical protein WKF47_09425 [Geodermatophilaceae bacterium]
MSSDRPRTLSEWLRGRPDEWLAALLRARPDLAVPVPGDLGVLASRIGIRVSVGRALEDLDAFTLQVLDGLLLSERTSSYADVRALLPAQVPDGAVHGAIDRLRDLAIVWGDNDELHLVVSVRELASPYPAGLGHPVGTLLRSLTDMQVAPILHTLDLPDRRQPEASQAIAGRYADASWLHEQLAGCGDAERAVLAHLGQAPLGQLPGAQRPWTPEQNGSPVRSAAGAGAARGGGPGHRRAASRGGDGAARGPPARPEPVRTAGAGTQDHGSVHSGPYGGGSGPDRAAPGGGPAPAHGRGDPWRAARGRAGHPRAASDRQGARPAAAGTGAVAGDLSLGGPAGPVAEHRLHLAADPQRRCLVGPLPGAAVDRPGDRVARDVGLARSGR